MTEVTIHKAKSNLSKLVAKAETGEQIIICRGPDAVAMLVPYRKNSGQRPKVGEITSKPIQIKPGCFAPLTDKEIEEWGMG